MRVDPALIGLNPTSAVDGGTGRLAVAIDNLSLYGPWSENRIKNPQLGQARQQVEMIFNGVVYTRLIPTEINVERMVAVLIYNNAMALGPAKTLGMDGDFDPEPEPAVEDDDGVTVGPTLY